MKMESLSRIGDMNKPLVSVIIPVYNAEAFIEKCCISLFEQTLNEIEYVFVNDQSKDKSLDIINSVLKRYPQKLPKVKIINNYKNLGVSRTRQIGLENATGIYIIHCDPDDWVDVTLYESMYNTARNTNSEIVICDYIEETSKTSNMIFQKIPTNKNLLFKEMMYHRIPSYLWNKLIRRQLLIRYKMGGVNLWEDFSIIPALMLRTENISIVHGKYYHYRVDNEKSITHKINKDSIISKIDALYTLEYNLRLDNLINNINIRDLQLIQWHTKRDLLSELCNSSLEEYESIFPVSFITHGWSIFFKDILIRVKYIINTCINIIK